MQVKVWNDNKHVLKEKFKGEDIVIQPGKFIEMELFEANDYRGQYLPPIKMADGTQDPTTYKMVRIEKPTDAKLDVVQNSHICMSCKKGYESEPVLKAHLETEHADAPRLEIAELDETIKKKKTQKAS